MGWRKKSLTIKGEIFLLSLAFLTIVSVVFTIISMGMLYENNMDSAKNSLRECNSHIVAYTEGIFHENAIVADILSQDVTIINGRDEDKDAILSIYDKIFKNNKNITYVYSGYVNGKLHIGNEDAEKNINPITRPWYQAALFEDEVVRTIYMDSDTGEWFVSHSKKLVDSNGKITGVVSIDCSNKTISRQLSTKYQYHSQRSYILNPDGLVLIHPEEKYINQLLTDYIDGETWEAVVAGTCNYGEYKKGKTNAMVYFERIPESDMIVATAIDAKEVIQPIVNSMEYLSVAMVAVSVILGIVLSRLLGYRFARPIIALKSRIEKVAGGNPEEEIEGFSFYNAEIKGIADGIEIIVKDIAKQEKKRKAAEYLSFHDSMTGLYNRRFLEKEQERLDTERYYPLCVICCDVNGLKLVNDIFGHDVGDQLICRVAECLTSQSRASDVVTRVGGDEFVILLPNTPRIVAQEIIMCIKESFHRENICGVEVSASLGYGLKEKKEESMDEIIRQTDNMMYGWKVSESTEMKRKTVEHIIGAASREGLVKPLEEKEKYVLDELTALFCPDTREILKQSYRLRKIGLCKLLQFNNEGITIMQRYTENSYRILSATDEYRSLGGYVLHYTEHWDGSGWPAGLAGWDIPLLSRIIAIVDAYFTTGNKEGILDHINWYDPEIVQKLFDILEDEKLQKKICVCGNEEKI